MIYFASNMGYVSYVYYLSDEDYIVVRFYSRGQRVVGFSVNYVSHIHGCEVTIRRYDMHHGKPHLDAYRKPIFKSVGGGRYRFVNAEQEKAWLKGEAGEIMRKGRRDIAEHWQRYRQAYIGSIKYR